MKWLIRIVVVLVIVVVVGLFAAFMFIDSIAKAAVEKGGTYATGVQTTLGSIHIGLLSGEVTMDDFKIANPEGYTDPDFLTLGNGEVQVSLGSLMADTVEVPLIGLHDVGMTIEKKEGKANYDVILENLEKLSKSDGKPKEESGGGKGYKIDKIEITNVHVKGYILEQPVDLKIPQLEMKDVGSDTSGGATLAQVQGEILAAILKAVATQGPEVLAGALSGQLSKLGDLGNVDLGNLSESVGNVGEGAGKVVEGLGQLGEGGAEGAGKAVEDIAGGIGGLLGGNKKDEEKKE